MLFVRWSRFQAWPRLVTNCTMMDGPCCVCQTFEKITNLIHAKSVEQPTSDESTSLGDDSF